MDPLLINVATLAAGAIGAVALGAFKRPAKMQDQLLMLALGGTAAYMMRQVEGRGQATDHHSNSISALSEQVKTLFSRMDTLTEKHDGHAEKVGSLQIEFGTLAGEVRALIARIDVMQGTASRRRAR